MTEAQKKHMEEYVSKSISDAQIKGEVIHREMMEKTTQHIKETNDKIDELKVIADSNAGSLKDLSERVNDILPQLYNQMKENSKANILNTEQLKSIAAKVDSLSEFQKTAQPVVTLYADTTFWGSRVGRWIKALAKFLVYSSIIIGAYVVIRNFVLDFFK